MADQMNAAFNRLRGFIKTQCLDCDEVYYRSPRCVEPTCPECGGHNWCTLDSEHEVTDVNPS